MENFAVALISVVGALLGTLMGGWLSLRATTKQHALQRQDQELRLLDDSFFRAIDELEAYRRLELTRAHESTLQGVSPADAPSAPDVRTARSVCRRALLTFKVHSQEPHRTHQLDQIFAEIETISDQPDVATVRAVSSGVTDRLEAAVVEFSELRQARLNR